MSLAPGLLIAAPRSGSGKTTIVLGLQRALARRGLRVRGMKCGPDYIDPAFHAAATGAPSFNLDSFAMGAPLLEALASEAARDAELVIAEGSMGLFDGIRQEIGRTGASADIAALFGWPVILVLDVSGHAQSAAAVALGALTLMLVPIALEYFGASWNAVRELPSLRRDEDDDEEEDELALGERRTPQEAAS